MYILYATSKIAAGQILRDRIPDVKIAVEMINRNALGNCVNIRCDIVAYNYHQYIDYNLERHGKPRNKYVVVWI